MCLTESRCRSTAPAPEAAAPTESAHRLTMRALSVIESSLTTQITVSQLAELSNSSPYHLSRVFARTTGHTPIGYLRARRLAEAASEIVHETGMDILTVALRYCYGSHAAFTHAFKRTYGISPSQLRSGISVHCGAGTPDAKGTRYASET